MTATELTYVWVVTKQADVSESSKGWAELETTDGGVPFVLAYRTRAAAEAAMRGMVPGGADPWTYAGLRVEREPNRGLFAVTD